MPIHYMYTVGLQLSLTALTMGSSQCRIKCLPFTQALKLLVELAWLDALHVCMTGSVVWWRKIFQQYGVSQHKIKCEHWAILPIIPHFTHKVYTKAATWPTYQVYSLILMSDLGRHFVYLFLSQWEFSCWIINISAGCGGLTMIKTADISWQGYAWYLYMSLEWHYVGSIWSSEHTFVYSTCQIEILAWYLCLVNFTTAKYISPCLFVSFYTE